MILIDYSSILHRKIFSSISQLKLKPQDGKYITSEFIQYTKYQILQELFQISTEFGPRFGELVICLDNKSPEGYWRKDVLSSYKMGRSKDRKESNIEFSEVWPELNALTNCIQENLPWKCVEVHRAEADDIILVLAEEFKKFNPDLDYSKPEVLIHSPDKDMIQVQFGTDAIKQYSALTNKYLTANSKADSLEKWLMEHVCLGDISDSVPKIVDGTEFSENFINYLKENSVKDLEPLAFRNSMEIPAQDKIKLIQDYDIQYYNRAGAPQGKDVYKRSRLGPALLTKAIAKHGSLDAYLDSNPLYRMNYERNKTLVLTEGIPEYIYNAVIMSYNEAKDDYNHTGLEEYLQENNLSSLLLEVPHGITSKRGEISVEDFW